MEKIINKLNSHYEGATMAIIKTNADTGVLVWMGSNPADYARVVTVRHPLGDDIHATLHAYTVGNFYGLGSERAEREFADIEKQMYADFEAVGRTDYGRVHEVNAARFDFESKCSSEAREILEAEIETVCLREEIITLLKHCGDNPQAQGIRVVNLDKGITIDIP